MMNDFMSLELLATFAGLVAAVSLIVQFTKSIIKKKFGDGIVRLYAFIIALVLTFIFAHSGTGADEILLTIINSIIVAITAMGGYEILVDPKAEKSK
jgi:hypothetical protein